MIVADGGEDRATHQLREREETTERDSPNLEGEGRREGGRGGGEQSDGMTSSQEDVSGAGLSGGEIEIVDSSDSEDEDDDDDDIDDEMGSSLEVRKVWFTI